MLTPASRIPESLVDRSCLCPCCRFFFFIGFGGAWPVTGMSFGKAGGASKTTSTPTCAKFSDVEALVVALEKRACNFQARLFISRGASCISRGCAHRQSGFAPERAARLASLTSFLASQRSDRTLGQLAWLQVCDTYRGKKGTKPTRLWPFSWEAQSRNRPGRRGAFLDVGSSEVRGVDWM